MSMSTSCYTGKYLEISCFEEICACFLFKMVLV